jgi:uncharacterized protein YjbJ (UPF0337 family)
MPMSRASSRLRSSCAGDGATPRRGISTTQEFIIMNKDQVKGSVKEAAGKVQEKTGQIIGSKEQQAKGMAKEVAGKAQKTLGDAKETVKDSARKP